MFTNPVTQSYDLTDATWEIVLMLLVAFLLGWFFHWFWSRTAQGESVENHEFARFKLNDLKIVEGIGPKIEELLKKNGITTWAELAQADIATIKNILATGGERFQMHDPSSWSDQASLAAARKWKDLEEYQNLLTGGRTFQA